MIYTRSRLIAVGLLIALLGVTPSNAATVDVVFLLSADGALGFQAFAAEKTFVENLVSNVLPFDTTQVGLVQYATGANIEVPLTLLNSASEPSIANTISNLSYSTGNTDDTDAVTDALSIFNSDPDTSDPKLMVLLQDNTPFPAGVQNPCDTSGLYPAAAAARSGLAADNVTTLELASGPATNSGLLACLQITSESQVLPISNPVTTAKFEAEDSTISGTVGALGPSAVPEPAGWSLLALGFVVPAVLRHRRRRKAA
jgi:hypothetical protein